LTECLLFSFSSLLFLLLFFSFFLRSAHPSPSPSLSPCKLSSEKVSFYDTASQRLLLAEADRVFKPSPEPDSETHSTITQQWHVTTEDEKIYGLGQYQNGQQGAPRCRGEEQRER
jgi:hypothetical protein